MVKRAWGSWREASRLWDAYLLRVGQWRLLPKLAGVAVGDLVLSVLLAHLSFLLCLLLGLPMVWFETIVKFIAFTGAIAFAVGLGSICWIGLRDLGLKIGGVGALAIAVVNFYVLNYVIDYQEWILTQVSRASPDPGGFAEGIDWANPYARWYVGVVALLGTLIGFVFKIRNAYGLLRHGEKHKQSPTWSRLQ